MEIPQDIYLVTFVSMLMVYHGNSTGSSPFHISFNTDGPIMEITQDFYLSIFLSMLMILTCKSHRIYEGESISNQPIPIPMDRDGHDFHALFQYMYYTWVQNCTRIESFFN